MFLLLFMCMCMTSSTELGPDQWVGPLIGSLTGMRGILILVYTAGIMFLLRFFVAGRGSEFPDWAPGGQRGTYRRRTFRARRRQGSSRGIPRRDGFWSWENILLAHYARCHG